MRKGWVWGWFLPLLIAAQSVSAAQMQVVLVPSDRSGPYLDAANAFKAELDRLGGVPLSRDVVIVSPGEPITTSASMLVVALGTDSCRQMVVSTVSLPVPVLCTLLPRISFERILQAAGRKPGPALSALFLNQPITRQFALIRLALPSARRVGVLVHPGPTLLRDPGVEAAAQALGLRLVLGDVPEGEPVYAPLKKVLDESDVLLAIADPDIYNASSLQNILMASFRARIPMIAFSPAYARAGALLALYSTPSQIGQQAAQLVRAGFGTGALAAPQHPGLFEISVNEQVARSLGLSLDAGQLVERLRRQERSP